MKRALIIAEDAEHARTLCDFLEEHELAGEILVQADPTNDIGAHESLHRLASLGTVAAGAAHEVNNLLTYVSAVLDRMDSGALDPANASDMIRTSLDCCHRMQSILRGITGYARNNGAQHLPLVLKDVVDQAIELVHGDLRNAAELEVSHQADMPVVSGNVGQLTQVLINLLINAIHAVDGAAPGRITVRTFGCEKHAVIAVEDNGHGIPEDKLDRVFEAFYSTKPGDVGTGLGLYLARSIARKHGGDIAVRSRPGVGTTIELRLPVAR